MSADVPKFATPQAEHNWIENEVRLAKAGDRQASLLLSQEADKLMCGDPAYAMQQVGAQPIYGVDNRRDNPGGIVFECEFIDLSGNITPGYPSL